MRQTTLPALAVLREPLSGDSLDNGRSASLPTVLRIRISARSDSRESHSA